MRKCIVIVVLLIAIAGTAWAGHTRPGYVDGCQSINGRFVVTAKHDTTKKQWQYTWLDKQENKTLTGWLLSVPDCQQGHFDVSYVHLFVAPDGETFAAFNSASSSNLFASGLRRFDPTRILWMDENPFGTADWY